MSTTLKPSYIAAVSLTVTHLNSLATDSNLLAGWSSAGRDNTSDLWVDAIVSGTLKTGTSPTASNWIELWMWEGLDDTPTYPDTITGSEAAITLTSTNVKYGFGRWVQNIIVDSTSNRVYPFSFRAASIFNGSMPKKAWGLYFVQNTGAALNSSGNVVNILGIQYQNV